MRGRLLGVGKTGASELGSGSLVDGGLGGVRKVGL